MNLDSRVGCHFPKDPQTSTAKQINGTYQIIGRRSLNGMVGEDGSKKSKDDLHVDDFARVNSRVMNSIFVRLMGGDTC